MCSSQSKNETGKACNNPTQFYWRWGLREQIQGEAGQTERAGLIGWWDVGWGRQRELEDMNLKHRQTQNSGKHNESTDKTYRLTKVLAPHWQIEQRERESERRVNTGRKASAWVILGIKSSSFWHSTGGINIVLFFLSQSFWWLCWRILLNTLIPNQWDGCVCGFTLSIIPFLCFNSPICTKKSERLLCDSYKGMVYGLRSVQANQQRCV